MILLYNLGVLALQFGFRSAAFFNSKASAFVKGRKGIFASLKHSFPLKDRRVVWIHCASLGEFEQGRPVIELLKKEYNDINILLTFFSPSGYEVRKNYQLATNVFYLPWDTASNAEKFVTITKPTLAVFVKYEFWYHYSKVLKHHHIPLLSISAIFRPQQIFFKSYGSFYRGILRNFQYFFVQNEASQKLLNSVGFENCAVAGDTRFDRVHTIVTQGEDIRVAAKFKGSEKTIVVGSCWQEDLDVLLPSINEGNVKFIIAPHEISESFLQTIERSINVKSIRYSLANDNNLEDAQVLIIDNVGMLSRLYRYGEFAFVGGAFGKGLHNILEAACYGVPILFGSKNFEKFQEAVDLINRGGAFAVTDAKDFKKKFEMINTPETFLLACEVTRSYVMENLGATETIMQYCRKLLK
jgi:3-deoxy-D-manno-octulosonic-acid transferase